MRVFTCNDGYGHNPVGFAAVVVAANEADARFILEALMRDDGLRPSGKETLVELDTRRGHGVLLVNGDY